MARQTRKPVYPSTTPTFDANTDAPLYYFPVNEVFVRHRSASNYKLFCDKWLVIMLDRDGYLYLFPSYKPEYKEYVEAFIDEYAPHITFDEVKSRLGTMQYLYIGNPN